MKKIIFSMAFIAISLLFLNCSSSQKEKMETPKETKMTEADTPAPEKKVDHPQYIITVTQSNKELGKITVETFPEIAPKMCANWDGLVSSGFYDGTAFHRVMPGFMIQGGDPNSKNKPKNTWGMGDPSQPRVPAEFSDIHHEKGILSTARSQDPNSATSQFFIMHGDSPHLDGQYTVFGKVIEGIEVVDKIVSVPTENPNRPIDKVEMKITKK